MGLNQREENMEQSRADLGLGCGKNYGQVEKEHPPLISAQVEKQQQTSI